VGLRIDREHFDEGDYVRFAERLERGLLALRGLLARPGFGVGPGSLGAEIELFLIDAKGRPLPLNRAVLRRTVDPRVTVELDRFNLECNLRPAPLAGRPFSALAEELGDALSEVKRAADAFGGRVAVIGILPTLRADDLGSAAMTDSPRYRALSAGLQRLRQAPFHIAIDGEDPLEVTCDDVTFEGANTSLQVHLRVDPDAFARTYNAAQLATAPVLATAANSPTFLGHRLWEETRVALFKQAVDDRSERRAHVSRVAFGTGWVQGGAFELFADSVAHHVPLLPIVGDEDPLACLREGGVPGLDELRLHHGTVWRWNRAVYDPAGGGHLRVEMRGLPAGPTVDDMVANTAFLVGLALGLAPDFDRIASALPFEVAERNFYSAARSGLDARLEWPGARGASAAELPVRELVPRLLPVAQRGLEAAGVDPDEAESRLEIVAARVRSGQTGARWQRGMLASLEPRVGRERALVLMLERYLECAERDEPVHRWALAEPGDEPRVRLLVDPPRDWIPEHVPDFLRWLGGPTLLRVRGRDRSRTRAVVTLLHGNEPSGVRAIHAYLRQGDVPAVDALFIVASVQAALEPPGFARRTAPGGGDLNRCFLPPYESDEARLAAELLGLLRAARPEALVDLHNNTGESPAYGVGPHANDAELDLLSHFADRYIASDLRLGALVEATRDDFPSVTVECGRAGDPAADAVARQGLARFLATERLGPRRHGIAVYTDPVRVRVRPGRRLVFADAPARRADLTVCRGIDRHNFEILPGGTILGWVRDPAQWPLEARDAHGRDRAAELFALEGAELRTRCDTVPIMMTSDPSIALGDCLFYAVQPPAPEG
jgi:gamma-glutamyl:cysteine ligase YbdK (ATP-grasp superfamily)